MTTCRACGWVNEPRDQRCAGCGAALHGGPPRPDPPPAPRIDRGPGVPRRSIPVRIAEPRSQPSVVPAGAGVPPSVPDGRVCSGCRRAVPPGRSFCACGAGLTGPAVDRVAPVLRPPSWWREGAAHRAFRRSMRAAGGGRLPPTSPPLRARVILVRALSIVLLAAVIGSQLGPWGAAVRQVVIDGIGWR